MLFLVNVNLNKLINNQKTIIGIFLGAYKVKCKYKCVKLCYINSGTFVCREECKMEENEKRGNEVRKEIRGMKVYMKLRKLVES